MSLSTVIFFYINLNLYPTERIAGKGLRNRKDAPHTLVEISRQLKLIPTSLSLDSLVDHGILGTVGFTPYGYSAIKGHYHAGKEEAAMLALDLLAKNHGYKTSVLIDIIEETMTKQMCRVILDSMWTYEKGDLDPFSGDHAIEYFIENALGKRHSSLISNSISFKRTGSSVSALQQNLGYLRRGNDSTPRRFSHPITMLPMLSVLLQER